LNEPDKDKYIEAMENAIQQHNRNNNWKVLHRQQVPSHCCILPSVWAKRRKSDLTTGEVIKWKERIKVDGSKQIKGLDFEATLAPVASWASIRIILLLAALNQWNTKQLDFVQAFPQAPVEQDLYIEMSKGCHTTEDNLDHVLKVLHNIYCQRQAGKVWFDYLTNGLISKLNFKQSGVDPCILWRGTSIMIIYTDDTIITGPDTKELQKIIHDISSLYNIAHKATVADFLGVCIKRDINKGTISLTQQKLIQSILHDIKLEGNINHRQTPAPSTTTLYAHKESTSMHEAEWSYRAVIGKLNYLEKSTRSDIAYSMC
jgi:Reverse transcriptase (RNA-dependent DNA polymerase)